MIIAKTALSKRKCGKSKAEAPKALPLRLTPGLLAHLQGLYSTNLGGRVAREEIS